MGLGNCTRAQRWKLTTSSQHSSNQMQSVVIKVFVFHHHTELSYMFRSSRHHHHHQGTKPTRHPIEPDTPLLLWFGSVVMIIRGSKHAGMFRVMMQYTCVRNSTVHFIG